MALKYGMVLLIVLACFDAHGTATRDNNMVKCWSNLVELKSCSNEIMHFFISGEADIGPNCCCAITAITHNCWPSMLTSLGYTYQEALQILAYCEDAAPPPALSPSHPIIY
ncbi:hypothetical protein LR48_Vigan01g017600 [Vigna angularis]|uniref:Prolamin-like domain-containing protein n=2 Tax=Phaseolus angularis TaxID=3914 RepID=A0A0L9TJM6_PHAAN|nr:hypothetical protein LR48_Vigan01g017600 [Vigna angularis]BAT73296.1 hypothetical protein VIGAN_01076900 [Vigna angularis var. angularis]